MIRAMLITTAATLAITAPLQAQDRGDRGKRGDQAEKSKAPRAERQKRAPRVERQAERKERPARAERQVVERQERAPRAERRIVERQERAPRVERRARQGENRAEAESRTVERRARHDENRAEASNRNAERRARQAENRAEASNRTTVRRARQAESQAKASNRTAERRARQVENRAEHHATMQRAETRARILQQRPPRQDRFDERIAKTQQRVDKRANRQERRADQRQDMWANLAQRRSARIDDGRSVRRALAQQVASVGQRIDDDRYEDRFENTVLIGYRSRFYDTARHYYRYDDDAGYLYQVRRDNNLVSALMPLLGGAFSVGRPLSYSYSNYDVPLSYQNLYYDTPDSYYRYGSGAIYQVDAGTQLIQAVVALLTGQSFGVGQVLPANYSTYNVPYAYRDNYVDTADNWYRYNDGNIYQVDPSTRLIEASIPMSYGGFEVGSLMPYGYDDYNVPNGYQQVYYDTPTYNYRYDDGGIYQVDPTTQIVQSLVALVTGQNFNVGQAMPASYGVYNVPYDYRDRYADTDDSWYRYSDGTIYQLDPGTRVIRDSYNIYA